MMKTYTIYPIGIIHKDRNQTSIEIYETFKDGLLGLDQFSHIIVFSWFHKNDTIAKRNTLRVHPRRNQNNPLTGVFATRSPARPNPIAITTCKILSIEETTILIDRIDSFDGTTVIDIKPFLPHDAQMDIKMPEWV